MQFAINLRSGHALWRPLLCPFDSSSDDYYLLCKPRPGHRDLAIVTCMFKLLPSLYIRSVLSARSVVAQHYKQRLVSAMAEAGELDEQILTRIGGNQEQNVRTKEVRTFWGWGSGWGGG